MQAELLAEIERELLSWPGVGKESGSGGPGRGGFWVSPFTSYKLGRKELGHIHQEIGVADLTFTREIHDRLVSEGRATAHAAGLQGVVSYEVRSVEDVAKALDLFRLNYDRLRESAERRTASKGATAQP